MELHGETGSWWSRRSTLQKVLMIAGGIIVGLMIIGAATGDRDIAAQETPADATATSPGSIGPGVGDTVSDGQFEFIVTRVEQPGSTCQPELLEDVVNGEWFIVDVSVENVGTEARTFYTGVQLITWGDRQLKGSDFTWNVKDVVDLNPGLKAETAIMFGVPQGFAAGGDGTVVVLHDSAFSGGAEVSF